MTTKGSKTQTVTLGLNGNLLQKFGQK